MRVHALEPTDHPDLHDLLIHFTGRSGASTRPPHIEAQSPWGRLQTILRSKRLLGFPQFGVDVPSVCFTEATSSGCNWLIEQGRYTSCGIALTKRTLFQLGAGPVLQVRGDEWAAVSSWPPSVRARAVRLWPGAEPEPGEALPMHLRRRSEWLVEREWRLPLPELCFTMSDVAFLVVPDREVLSRWTKQLREAGDPLAEELSASRWVVLGARGIEDAHGVTSRGQNALLVD